jgi:hypothetical protein
LRVLVYQFHGCKKNVYRIVPDNDRLRQFQILFYKRIYAFRLHKKSDRTASALFLEIP